MKRPISSSLITLSTILIMPTLASAMTVEITDDGNGNQTANAIHITPAEKGTDLQFCNATPRYYALTAAQMEAAIDDLYETILATADESTFGGAYTDGTVVVTTRTFVKDGEKKCKRRQADGPTKIVRVKIEKEMFVVAAVLSFTDGMLAESDGAAVGGDGCYFLCPEEPTIPQWEPMPYPVLPTYDWYQPPSSTWVGTQETRRQRRKDRPVLWDCSVYTFGSPQYENCTWNNSVMRQQNPYVYDPVYDSGPSGINMRQDMALSIAQGVGDVKGWTNVYNYDPNYIDTSNYLYQPYNETLFVSYTPTTYVWTP